MSLRLTADFLAKYPFTSVARGIVASWGVRVEELGEARHRKDVERALFRIREALERGEAAEIGLHDDPEVDVISFPIALMIVSSVGDGWLSRRWALAEAVRCESFISTEDASIVIELLRELDISVEKTDEREKELSGFCDFKVRIRDYLIHASRIDALEWKLVNRVVRNGWVYVSQRDLARLAREAIIKRILERLADVKLSSVPDFLKTHIEEIRSRLASRRGYEEAVVSSSEENWPPCMKALKSALIGGQNVGHFGNFAFASFLFNIGYTVESVISMYAQRSDFDERLARYQAEHIAGMKGSRTKYTTPSCTTMRTHGLCIEDGRLCPGIKNPLQYYKRAARKTARSSSEVKQTSSTEEESKSE
ncbi:MAG: DNA primase large subunit PriL [Nitrososphaerota archaeon]